MITFNVFGCCVSRDTLELLEEQNKACVLQTVSATTTISAFSEKPDRIYTMYDFDEYSGANFQKRITCQDINKTSISYLLEKRADYMVIDLLNNRLSMFKKGGHYMTISLLYAPNKDLFQRDFHIEEYEYIKLEDLTFEAFMEGLDRFCSIILQHYSPNQIILNKLYAADFYMDKGAKKAFSTFDGNNITKFHQLIKEMYNYVEKKLKGCHIINPPDNIVADSSHKWGLHYLHFHKFFYIYNAKAIEIVCSNLPNKEELFQLEELRQIYSEKFELLSVKADLEERNNYIKGAKNALDFTKILLNDIFDSDKFISNLKKIKENNLKVSVLKAADMAGQILIKALRKYDIPIVFQSEYWNLESMKVEDFEKCRQADLIICAHIHIAPVHEQRNCKITHIYDLIYNDLEIMIRQ